MNSLVSLQNRHIIIKYRLNVFSFIMVNNVYTEICNGVSHGYMVSCSRYIAGHYTWQGAELRGRETPTGAKPLTY